jgi:glycerate kinase
MNIIIAPNSFKGSLDAFKVAKSIERGLKKSALDVACELFPIADGGDHTLEVFVNWLGGTIHKAEVSDPIGKKNHRRVADVGQRKYCGNRNGQSIRHQFDS